MKTLVTLSGEQILLLKANGNMRNDGQSIWYNLPQWFIDTDQNNVFEVVLPNPQQDKTEVFVIVCQHGIRNPYQDFVYTNCDYAEKLVSDFNIGKSKNDASILEVMNIYDFGEYMHNSGSSAAMFE